MAAIVEGNPEIIVAPSLTSKLTKNKVGRPRFSFLFGTVINHSPQLKREDSGSSEASAAYTTASEADTASTSVLEPPEATSTSPTITPAAEETDTTSTSPTITPTAAQAEAEAEICPTCKARTLSTDSVPKVTMKDTTPSTSPRPEAAAPLSSHPPAEADQDKITPVTSVSPEAAASPEAASPDINYKANKKHQRPKLQRNLSSLWKILDPPELRTKTGMLHDLAQQESRAEKITAQARHGKNKSSVDSITLHDTMSHRAYRQ